MAVTELLVNFAEMRSAFIGLMVFCFIGCVLIQKASAQKGDTSQPIEILVAPPDVVNPDTIPLYQIDGTLIHLVGVGNIFVTYTETTDGYTLWLNKEGLYEYAKYGPDGGLLASGILAHDPEKREKKEIKLLKKYPRHLRYQGPKLQEILNRQKKQFTPDKKLKKNEK